MATGLLEAPGARAPRCSPQAPPCSPLAFAVSGLGNSSVFGWKQELVCIAGVAVGVPASRSWCADRRGAGAIDARHELLVAAAQLLGLCALAVAQPLFDLLSDNAEFFVAAARAASTSSSFTVALALGPPLVLFAAELLAGLAGRAPGGRSTSCSWRRSSRCSC